MRNNAAPASLAVAIILSLVIWPSKCVAAEQEHEKNPTIESVLASASVVPYEKLLAVLKKDVFSYFALD